MKEAEEFYRTRLIGRYCLAICLKEDGFPVGYIHADEGDSHDFGYALRRNIGIGELQARLPPRSYLF